MAVETADDRLILLADFGVSVTYTYVSGAGTKTITGIFDNQYEAVDAGGGVAFAMQQPKLTVRTADIVGATDGDKVVIDGIEYYVRVIMQDGTGITELMLEIDGTQGGPLDIDYGDLNTPYDESTSYGGL